MISLTGRPVIGPGLVCILFWTEIMIVEFAVFVAFTILTGALIVKIYEWRQNVPVKRRVRRR